MKQRPYWWMFGIVVAASLVGTLRSRLFSAHGEPPSQDLRVFDRSAAALRANEVGPAPPSSKFDGSEAVAPSGSGAQGANVRGRPRRPSYAKQAAVAEDPELREDVTRRTEKDYSALFAKLRLSPEKEDALSMILVDWFFASRMSERVEYDRMVAELLGPEQFAEFTDYRAELTIKDFARAAVRAAEPDRLAGSTPARDSAIESVVRNALHSGDPLWVDAGRRSDQGIAVSDAEIKSLVVAATQEFESALRHEGVNLTEIEKNRLRDWYQTTIVQFKARALQLSQLPGG